MTFTPHFNPNTNTFTLYLGGKEFSSFTYQTLTEAQAKAADLQTHFFPMRIEQILNPRLR